MRSYLKNTKLIIPSLSKTFNFVKKFDLIEEIPGHNLLDKEEKKRLKVREYKPSLIEDMTHSGSG